MPSAALRTGPIFSKKTKNCKTREHFCQKTVCIAIESKQQKTPAIKKLQNCKCDKWCRFADRALEAKIAQVTSENQNFDGRLKRNWDEPKGQKSDKCRKDGQFSAYLRPSMLQKVHFWRQSAQSWISKICFLLERGAYFCKNTKKCPNETTCL